jgi:uncharacterized membrane protein YhaH (DUF805 family)
MEGRCDLACFFFSWLVIVLVGVGVGLIAGNTAVTLGVTPRDRETVAILELVMKLAILVVLAFPVVKRLHDLDRPGTHYWPLLIPFYNIYLMLVLFFKKGTEGPNRYGPATGVLKYTPPADGS